MGNDGGTIATSRRHIRGAKKDDAERRADKEIERSNFHSLCALSQKPFRAPIVGCKLGFLFNKEEILQSLLDKSLPETFSHIKKLKDLTTLVVTSNPSFPKSSQFPFICPVTRSEFDDKTQFVFSKNSGKLISQKAFQMDPLIFSPKDRVVSVLPKEKDLQKLKRKIFSRNQKSVKKKKLSVEIDQI